jgi:hypothetical protein
MARTFQRFTISLRHGLADRMRELKQRHRVNWSAIAQVAFEKEVERLIESEKPKIGDEAFLQLLNEM